MQYKEWSNTYNEWWSWDVIDENTPVVYTPESQWLITEDGKLMITETLYEPQLRVASTDFLVVKDL